MGLESYNIGGGFGHQGAAVVQEIVARMLLLEQLLGYPAMATSSSGNNMGMQCLGCGSKSQHSIPTTAYSPPSRLCHCSHDTPILPTKLAGALTNGINQRLSEMADALREAQHANGAIAAALISYSRHREGCAATGMTEDCTCGLVAILTPWIKEQASRVAEAMEPAQQVGSGG